MDDKQVIMGMLAERYKKARPRGRDMRKLPKPYSCREVVYTCSNGWTVEKLPVEDFAVEGFFMGHCMGGKHGPKSGSYYSLRESDGTPHVTIDLYNGYFTLYGRCNKYPKAEYVTLLNEWFKATGKQLQNPHGSNRWGYDVDEEYHSERKLTDADYRDTENGMAWRDKEWQVKREGGRG